MQQIVSITDARNNLSRLVAEVASQDKTIVIVRDSAPEAALVPYAKVEKEQEEEERKRRLAWSKLLREGRKFGKTWAKKRGIDLSKLSDDELYDLVDKM